MENKSSLRKSWLIQRLELSEGRINPFSFGGGLKNGGLSDEFAETLCHIFSFDYMGAAQFEFGIIRDFFENIKNDIKIYSGWEIKINKIPVYIFGQKDLKIEINKRLEELSEKEGEVREFCGFCQAVGLEPDYPKEKSKIFGWLELDNNFAFFVDKQMFEKFCDVIIKK